MADEDKRSEAGSGIRSAWEVALERLEDQGIEGPASDRISEEDRERIAQIRQEAEAKIAELEILHRDRLRGADSPAAREEEKEDYRRERQRIEERRDREIEKIRSG